MIKLFAKIFIKNTDDVNNAEVRRKYGFLCGGLGMFLNLLLFAGKYAAGVLSGSIAITADAFNNLSDAGSSVITLFGFKLAGRRPDPNHPFGHGRIEYLSGFLVSMIVLLMGFELAKSSVQKILAPEEITFSWLVVGILAASICAKLYMLVYNRSVGRKIKSAALFATAADSLSDSVATLVVLAATVLSKFTDLNIDAYCGLAVSLFILYEGFLAARDTLSPLLGQKPEPELIKNIEKIVLSDETIMGIHDMVVHDYGPGRLMVSLHAEVPADRDIFQLHDAIDNIEETLNRELGCESVIHMDPIDVNSEDVAQMRKRVYGLVRQVDESLTIHDFRMVPGSTHTNLIFDVVVPHGCKKSDGKICEEIQELVSDMEDTSYFAVLKIDRSYV